MQCSGQASLGGPDDSGIRWGRRSSAGLAQYGGWSQTNSRLLGRRVLAALEIGHAVLDEGHEPTIEVGAAELLDDEMGASVPSSSASGGWVKKGSLAMEPSQM